MYFILYSLYRPKSSSMSTPSPRSASWCDRSSSCLVAGPIMKSSSISRRAFTASSWAPFGQVPTRANRVFGLLQIEWVKWGGFSRVDGDFKGFVVNLTVTSWRHVCPHAKIDQDEAPERS